MANHSMASEFVNGTGNATVGGGNLLDSAAGALRRVAVQEMVAADQPRPLRFQHAWSWATDVVVILSCACSTLLSLVRLELLARLSATSFVTFAVVSLFPVRMWNVMQDGVVPSSIPRAVEHLKQILAH
eukprot:m.483465 g.483465  ORF g.483465 m.483465 type:complete len:129 (+) comp22947_c0_seq1:1206-1592(+)